MDDKICLHFVVTGKVQGVWFRASTKAKAEEWGIQGWVRNLPSGQVEVLASGAKEPLAKLQAWLEHGPALAAVSHLFVEEWPWQAHDGFVIR